MESNRSSLYLFTGVVVLTFALAIVLTVVYVSQSPGGATPQALAQASDDGSESSAAQPQGSGDDGASDGSGSGSSSDGSEASDESEASDGSGSSDEQKVEVVDGVQVVKLTGDDQMKYNINEFRVKAGQPVRIEFEHVGKLPKQAMGHNVTVLEPGTDYAAFAQKGAQAAQNDYIPQDEAAQKKIVANTEMVGGGDSTSIEFTIEEPGTYPYVCTFPAHFQTMNGEMIVEPSDGAGDESGSESKAKMTKDSDGGDDAASGSGSSKAESGEDSEDDGEEDDGEEDDGDGAGDPNVKTVDGVQVIKITGNDQMQYNINEFRVKAGQPVRLEFENVGSFPKQAMGHNVVVLTRGTSHAGFAQKAAQAAQNGYIPQDDAEQEKILANTELLGPGETDTIEFTIEEAGTYPYVCTFPAHFATMNGEMIVEE